MSLSKKNAGWIYIWHQHPQVSENTASPLSGAMTQSHSVMYKETVLFLSVVSLLTTHCNLMFSSGANGFISTLILGYWSYQKFWFIWLSIYLFIWWDWGLNSGLRICKAGSGYFGDGVLWTICLGWPWTASLLIIVSRVARITDMSHNRNFMIIHFFLVPLFWKVKETKII
jgi:hypothetical protein